MRDARLEAGRLQRKFSCYMWEGYTTAHETRVRHMRHARLEAGRLQRMRHARARLVFEEVSLVHGLVECSIALVPHLLLAASRRGARAHVTVYVG